MLLEHGVRGAAVALGRILAVALIFAIRARVAHWHSVRVVPVLFTHVPVHAGHDVLMQLVAVHRDDVGLTCTIFHTLGVVVEDKVLRQHQVGNVVAFATRVIGLLKGTAHDWNVDKQAIVLLFP